MGASDVHARGSHQHHAYRQDLRPQRWNDEVDTVPLVDARAMLRL
jgi:hypothetical protein